MLSKIVCCQNYQKRGYISILIALFYPGYFNYQSSLIFARSCWRIWRRCDGSWTSWSIFWSEAYAKRLRWKLLYFLLKQSNNFVWDKKKSDGIFKLKFYMLCLVLFTCPGISVKFKVVHPLCNYNTTLNVLKQICMDFVSYTHYLRLKY